MWRGSGERVGKSKSERACMIKSAGKVRGKRGGEGKTWREFRVGKREGVWRGEGIEIWECQWQEG